MSLKQKISKEDIALLEVIEDEVWLGQFLRTSGDGQVDKTLWSGREWNYRDYQKQFLTDKTQFILYTGGRSIGKCSPSGAKILTVNGYKTLGSLSKLNSFIAYTLTPEMTLEQRRAVAIHDKLAPAYTVTTESGYKFVGTQNHPMLTPEGYKVISMLKEGNYVAVATFLPYESVNNALRWHELRIIGYTILNSTFRAETKITPRYKKIGAELEAIAARMLLNWHKDFEGRYSLYRKPGPFKHPITSLYQETRLFNAMRQYGLRRLPDIIKHERLENIQVFLEALFAQFATISDKKVSVKTPNETVAQDLQELLLRFGIETKVYELLGQWYIETRDYRAAYRFWNTFTLPGVSVGTLPLPASTNDATEFMRYDRITSIYMSHEMTDTYAVYVYEDENYISDNCFVHNSVIIEDKLIYEIINSDKEFPITRESVLVTPNQAQMTPLLNKIIIRFTSSPLLRGFLNNNVNRSEGTMKFMMKQRPMIFHFRIAGSRGEQNMVGLHIPRIRADETQLFPLQAWTQLMPALNSWEPKTQIIAAGVPNGLRNSVLYQLDLQNPRYKKYRIPAHNNPYYTKEDNDDNIRRYGGEQDDRYQQLVLGRHGAAAFQVIPRETITTETFPFYSLRYNSSHVTKGLQYHEILQRPRLPDNLENVVMSIDTGFVDPTIIHIIGRDNKRIWRTYIRYRLTRIDFEEQQKIIDWLASYYNIPLIAIDIGAGGGGAGIMHNLMNAEQYKTKGYDKRIVGLQFNENVIAGYDDEGEELVQDSKGYAANELAKTIQEGALVFSEIDNEGISQMERVAKQKTTGGKDRYFILSDKGAGADEDDHIFASYICFILGIRQEPEYTGIKKLGKASGAYTQ